MQRAQPPIARQLAAARRPGVRFQPVMHGETGETLGTVALALRNFEESPSFGPAVRSAEIPCPTHWLARHIESIGRLAQHKDMLVRPILVQAPLMALAHPDTAAACLAAIKRSHLCAQEICLEFPDAAYAADPTDALHRIERLRRSGFRVGIDMRRAAATPLTASLRLMLDTLRLDAATMLADERVGGIAEIAAGSGMTVIAQDPYWREAEHLSELGAFLMINPRTDT